MGGDTKNPRRCDSKGLKANAALESGNEESRKAWRKRENGKKSGKGGGKGIGGLRKGVCAHRRVSRRASEPVGVKHGRGAPPINQRNQRARLCRSLPTAVSAAGTGEDCNN